MSISVENVPAAQALGVVARTEGAARLFFYRGLLLGLRAAGVKRFPAQSEAFHDAFESTVLRARRIGGPVVNAFLARFLLLPDAREMLREGEDDAVLRLTEPDLHEARFLIDERQAEKGLEHLGAVDAFLDLGHHFRQQLVP